MVEITVQIEGTNEYCGALARALIRIGPGLRLCVEMERQPGQDVYLMEETASASMHHSPPSVVSESGEQTIVLVETQSDADPKARRYYKYGRVLELYREILMIAAQQKNNPLLTLGGSDCHLISVISSSGGSGCSVVAQGLARDISLYSGKKVLLLSFDLFDEPDNGEPGGTAPYGLKEYLYYLEAGEEQKCTALQSFLTEDEYGIRQFASGTTRNLLLNMDRQALFVMIQRLIRDGSFDLILCDIGTQLGEETLALLECSHAILFLQGRRDRSCREWLETRMGTLPGDRICHVRNRLNPEQDELCEECGVPGQSMAGWEEENADVDRFHTAQSFSVYDDTALQEEMNLDGDFGEGIHRISEWIASL